MTGSAEWPVCAANGMDTCPHPYSWKEGSGERVPTLQEYRCCAGEIVKLAFLRPWASLRIACEDLRGLGARCAALHCLERRCIAPEGVEFARDESMEWALMAKEDTALAHRLSFFVVSRMVSEGWLTQCQGEYMVPEALLTGTWSWELLERALNLEHRGEPEIISVSRDLLPR